MNEDGTMTFSSSEYIQSITLPPAIGGVTSTVPSGGILSLIPSNPRFIDGTRLSLFLAAYDQFCIESIIFEYVAGATFTQPGQLMMVYVNDISDDIVTETGLDMLRDAYSRPGRALGSVLKNLTIEMGRPLLKWYYTASEAGGPFEMPGFILVINQLAIANTTDVAVPLGSLVAHYRVRVRSPTFDAHNTLNFWSQSAILTMTNAYIEIGEPVYITFGASGMPTNSGNNDAFYWAYVVSTNDTGPGTSLWRTWSDPSNPGNTTISAGNLLIWRPVFEGPNLHMYFYPNIGSAIESAASGNYALLAYTATSTVAAGGLKGFKLWNITGSNLQGNNLG